jgi:hypothetical protein
MPVILSSVVMVTALHHVVPTQPKQEMPGRLGYLVKTLGDTLVTSVVALL